MLKDGHGCANSVNRRKVYAGSNQLFANAATGQHHTIRHKHGTLPDVALVNATYARNEEHVLNGARRKKGAPLLRLQTTIYPGGRID